MVHQPELDQPPSQYFPFAAGTWRMRLGLTALDLEDWIQIDCQFQAYLAEKRRLLCDRPDEVFAALPGSEAAQHEVLELLLAHLPQRFPGLFAWADGAIANRATGEIWPIDDFAQTPLDLAGRLVQEDLCILLRDPAGYVFAAGSLCFPLYWRLRDKLGQPLGQIHHPVPGYGQTLQHPVDNLFERLTPEHPGYRLNWSIVDTPALFLGVHRQHQMANDITPANAGDRLWIRVERQTLRRLPRTGGVLFAVRTYVYPLSLLSTKPRVATGLARAIAQMPPEMQLYKSLTPVRAALEGYLQQVGGDPS